MSASPRQTVPRQLASVKAKPKAATSATRGPLRQRPQRLAMQQIGEGRGRDLDAAKVDAVSAPEGGGETVVGLGDLEFLLADEHDPTAQFDYRRRRAARGIGDQQVGDRNRRKGPGRA